MNRFRFLALAPALGSLAAMGAVTPAGAVESVARRCVRSSNSAQELRTAGKMLEARTPFSVCAASECPEQVRLECEKQLEVVNTAVASVIFEMKDGAGADLSLVDVMADGKPLVKKLDGTALEFDPGVHEFTFTVPGEAPVSLSLVLREGEKRRRERVTIGAPVSPTPAVEPTVDPGKHVVTDNSESPPVATSHPKSAQRIAGLTVAGVGVLGLGVGGVFGVLGFVEKGKQVSDCGSSSNCLSQPDANHDHKLIGQDATASNIAFAAGGALLVTGAIVYLTAKPNREPSLVVVPSVGPNAAGVLFSGKF